MSPGLECDLRNIDVETVSDIVVEAEYMLVSHNFAPERANQTYFKISVILLLSPPGWTAGWNICRFASPPSQFRKQWAQQSFLPPRRARRRPMPMRSMQRKGLRRMSTSLCIIAAPDSVLAANVIKTMISTYVGKKYLFLKI